MSYDADYYEQIREGAQGSAAAIVPLVFEAVQPESVVDVGCGEGHFGKAFQDRGCEVLGIENAAQCVIPTLPYDLGKSLPELRRFDLALCLEVVEHLPQSRAESFIAELCGLAPVILFSAAIPEQGGEGHQNEQWPAYWAGLFEQNGYACSAAPRWEIWEDERVESWYRQNLMVAAKRPARFPRWFDGSLATHPHPVVHPAFLRDLMEFIHVQASLGKIEWR